ncbi:LOW QUALITY PROTEIN: hypothetical protein JCM19045_4389 [Bacillus sp. JCM 19045]|nr:LOW QUALITY PROTEIN: hypothetical protein JCM19045_4389 [Bacillus sp. JCM 19045]
MERLWTKPFILMTVSLLFLFTSFYMLYPTMPLYIVELGGNESHVGLAMGAFMLAAVCVRPFVGALLDRFGRKSFILWGLILFSVAMISYQFAYGLIALVVFRVIHGVSWGVSTTAVLTTVTDLIPEKRRGRGLGWSGMAMTISMAIGPMIGVWFVEGFSFTFLFVSGTILALVALVLASRVNVAFAKPVSSGKNLILFDKQIIPISVSTFFVFVSYGGITTFIPLYAASISFHSGTFFIYALTLLLTRPVAGMLADRYSDKMVIVPALGVTTVALVILAFFPSATGMIVASILYGIGFGSVQPALQATTIRRVATERIGSANASFSTATDLGIGLGAMLLGVVSQFTSFRMLFLVSAMSVLLSLLVFTVIKRNEKVKENTRKTA